MLRTPSYRGCMAQCAFPLEVGDGWQIVETVRNPWGRVPMTGGGRSLSDGAQHYMARLEAQVQAQDTVSRRHHYVPQAYLRQWSTDNKRVWTWDTATGAVRPLGIRGVGVAEDFYRVIGSDGVAHNRVELLFGVVDTELRRIQRLFNQLDDPEVLTFDDLLGLGVSIAVQRMRTVQERRLRLQHDAWLVAQNPHEFATIRNDSDNPLREAGIHTKLLFDAMWESADVLTSRQIEIWLDTRGRFITCDAPVLTPFRRNVRPNLVAAPYILWPISPHRVVALSNDLRGQKAVLREATGQMVGMVRQGVLQGRERMIFASEEQRDRLSEGKTIRRRAQSRMRCSQFTPSGGYVPPPGCCTEWSVTFAAGPDVVLCQHGLHRPAPDMRLHI